MALSGAVVLAGGAEVGSNPLVEFAVGPAGELELAGGDGSPVGRREGPVVLAGPELTGAVPFAALVTFAEGEAVGAVALPVECGAVPLKEVGAAPLSEGPGDAVGAVPLPVADGGMVPDVEVALPGNGVGAAVLPGAGAVPFDGRGSSKVVEFRGTTMLVAIVAVALVGAGEIGVVEFDGTEPPVEAGADTDALLGAVPELGGGGGELTPVPDGSGAGVVPFSVGKGADVAEDPGSGGKEVSPDGRGAKTVVELVTMIRLVAAAEPLMLMVVIPVTAPTDEIALIGTELEDSLTEGSGTTTVGELAGAMTLVSAAVPLMTMVVRLPVITPGGGAVVPEIEDDDKSVGNGVTTVVELRGTTMLVAAAVPLTKMVEILPGISLGLTVLLANGAEVGITEALADSEGGGAVVTVVKDGPGEGPEMH